uniref:Uncharacterized protein n=1 Tax=viral metagenome TaxID=1070528 RepID=A0A6C0JVS2_9ZZZZ
MHEYHNEEEVIDKFIAFKRIIPFSLYHNCPYYKFYGLKIYRVCYSCFENKLMYCPRIQMLREIGQRVKFMKKSYTKTEEEIENWNRLFSRYLKNSV